MVKVRRKIMSYWYEICFSFVFHRLLQVSYTRCGTSMHTCTARHPVPGSPDLLRSRVHLSSDCDSKQFNLSNPVRIVRGDFGKRLDQNRSPPSARP